MNRVEIIKAGLFTSIQDGGRKGMAFYGIPKSGFMDRESAQIANLLVGNKKNSCLIEMTDVGASFLFHEDACIALTGANMSPSLNNSVLPMYETVNVDAGSIIELRKSINGVRSYLAIHGKWKVKKVHGSASTYSYAGLGGLAGRPLKKGDLISMTERTSELPIVSWPKLDEQDYSQITITKGPEFELLKDAQSIQQSFFITQQSDRMGAVLQSSPIPLQLNKSFSSKPVFPGVIQCTPSGKLIVVLQDGQTTGGYPRVGIIPLKELDKFNQIPINNEFKFVLD